MNQSAQRELAGLLATLRREGRQQSGLDRHLLPPDKATAYGVARMVEEELGWEVAGWKIAAMKEPLQRQLRTDSPIYGRVFAPLIVESVENIGDYPACDIGWPAGCERNDDRDRSRGIILGRCTIRSGRHENNSRCHQMPCHLSAP
jgi:hypothetical protein